MLDALTTRHDNGSLTFTVYRKPTHTDQYLFFTSNQPLQHKLGVIRTLHHRCMMLCSNEDLKIKELDHFKKVLSVSDYTKSAWHVATKGDNVGSTTHQQSVDKQFKNGSVTLPYVGLVTDAVV